MLPVSELWTLQQSSVGAGMKRWKRKILRRGVHVSTPSASQHLHSLVFLVQASAESQVSGPRQLAKFHGLSVCDPLASQGNSGQEGGHGCADCVCRLPLSRLIWRDSKLPSLPAIDRLHYAKTVGKERQVEENCMQWCAISYKVCLIMTGWLFKWKHANVLRPSCSDLNTISERRDSRGQGEDQGQVGAYESKRQKCMYRREGYCDRVLGQAWFKSLCVCAFPKEV